MKRLKKSVSATFTKFCVGVHLPSSEHHCEIAHRKRKFFVENTRTTTSLALCRPIVPGGDGLGWMSDEEGVDVAFGQNCLYSSFFEERSQSVAIIFHKNLLVTCKKKAKHEGKHLI